MSEKFGVSQAAIKAHSAAEDWKGKKKTYINSLHREAQARAKEEMIEDLADNLNREVKIACKISELLDRATSEQMEIWTLNADGESESRVDIAALEKAAKILKQIEEVKRSLCGLTTVQEDRVYTLNKERLEIERERLKRDTGDEEEGGGVLILPDVDGYEVKTDE